MIDKACLPILISSERVDYLVEGYAQLDSNHLLFRNDNQLQYDCIENEEITETNKEYSFYSKHYRGQVEHL